MSIKRGDIYYADLSPVVGEEEGGIRPVIILSNNNDKETIIIAAITSKSVEKSPAHVTVDIGGLFPSTVLLNHLRTIDKRRLKEFITTVDQEYMQNINAAICTCLGL